MKRLLRALSVVAIVVLVSSGMAPANAAAPTCTNPHCYAIADWVPGFYLGNVSAHLYATNLQDLIGDSNSFIDLEMWAITGPNTWVETGMTTGHSYLFSSQVNNAWFMADSRRNGTSYNEHFASFSSSLSTEYPMGLHYHGNGIWNVQRSDRGTWFTSSGNPNNPATEVQAGTELYVNGKIYGCGIETGLAYQVSGSTTQRFGWNGATVYKTADPPSSGAWTSYPNALTFQVNSGC